MNFTLLSPFGFATGLFALAGGLYLLQRLRVRHREVAVVTTLFWHEAVHETRARMLVQRFRHPWAYALILLICGLLWSALAAPERDLSPQKRHVFLLDSSAAMARGERFGQAKARLLELAELAPREAREVIACGARLESLLLPGEEVLLLEARLAGLVPDAAGPSLHRALDAIALRADVPTSVLVFGDSPLDSAQLALLPDGVTAERVDTRDDGVVPSESHGITALGVSLAESGAWDQVDVLVEVTGNQGDSPQPNLTLDGKPIEGAVVRRELGAGTVQYVVRDVSARGGRFEARLPADDLTLDDHAAFVLPDRPLLRVLLSPSLDGALRPALESDPAIVLVQDDATLVVRRLDEDLGPGLPALVFAPAATQEQSFLVQYASERSAESVLEEAVGALALAEIDATSLAQAADQPITLGARRGAQRQIVVWAELVGDGFDFIDSRAFPLFVGGSLRWLMQCAEFSPWFAAGETHVSGLALRTEEGIPLRSVGLFSIPPVAGEYTADGGTAVSVALLSSSSTLAQALEGVATPLKDAASGAGDPVTWLLILAVLLLLFEWRQVRTGRMP